eukprot:g10465.t1
MTENTYCPQCGARLPEDAPGGICPKCLMRAGLESEPDAGPRSEFAPTERVSGFVPPDPEDLDRHFPHLEIVELLGRGGMGAVYKARQPGLDRTVAVKILPPEVGADPAFAERFTREARALARLSHQSIVSIYDSGNAGGQYYIVMEYVDGANLRQLIETKAIRPEEALAIVPQICEALQFAHDAGIVHRDIKPENILVDKQGRVKIADFGLAKLLGKVPTDASLTGTHQAMGTLHYMAPEQMQGAGSVDHRADIYSLGVVFYELLTGQLPLGRFAPPSEKVQVDVRLDEIVLRALENEPARRYQHVSDVKSEVEQLSSAPWETSRPIRDSAATAPRMSRKAIVVHRTAPCGRERAMKSLPVAEIWSRAVADEPITTFEEFKLTSALESADNPGLRRQLIRDEQIAGLLSSLGHCALAEDDFVAKVARRLQPVAPGDFTNRFKLPAGRRPAADAAPPVPMGDQPAELRSVASDVANRVGQSVPPRIADPVRDAGSHEVAGVGTGRHPAWRQRAAIGGAVAVALLLGVVTGFVVRGPQTSAVPDESGSISGSSIPGSSQKSPAGDSKSRLDPVKKRQQPEAHQHRNQQVGNKPAEGTIARLNASPQADWEASPPERLKAGVLKLRGGVASLEFDNGATIRLQGATELDLVSAGEATLRSGRLSATVPPKAVGFTINTPAGRIVDLGTEFDVDVNPDGSTNVAVRVGRVKVIPSGATDPAAHRELTAGERLTLAPPAAKRRAAAGGLGRLRKPQRRPAANGPIVRGITIINGRRFEYNSQEELEELQRRFPELRDERGNRSKTTPAPQQQRLRGRAGEKTQPPATSQKMPAAAGQQQAAAKKKKLYGIAWHPDLKAALADASQNKRPVMVLRVLGNLSGFM